MIRRILQWLGLVRRPRVSQAPQPSDDYRLIDSVAGETRRPTGGWREVDHDAEHIL